MRCYQLCLLVSLPGLRFLTAPVARADTHRRLSVGFMEVAKLVASDAAERDSFGYSVAIDGDTIVVGASNDGNTGLIQYDGDRRLGASNDGSVYVFRTTDGGATYDQVARLAPSDAGSGDLFGTFSLSFGSFVAIAGNTVVVGAYGDVLGTRTSGYDDDWGSAYVFRTSDGVTYVEVAKLTAADAAKFHYFGWSVAIDGGTVMIGAPALHVRSSDSGSVYVFREEGSGGAAGAATASVGLIVGLVVAAAVVVVLGYLALNRFRSQSRASEQAAAADTEDIKLEATLSDAADEMAAAEPSTGQKQAAP